MPQCATASEVADTKGGHGDNRPSPESGVERGLSDISRVKSLTAPSPTLVCSLSTAVLTHLLVLLHCHSRHQHRRSAAVDSYA